MRRAKWKITGRDGFGSPAVFQMLFSTILVSKLSNLVLTSYGVLATEKKSVKLARLQVSQVRLSLKSSRIISTPRILQRDGLDPSLRLLDNAFILCSAISPLWTSNLFQL